MNVDAFKPCSAVQIQYVSIALTCSRVRLATPSEQKLLGGRLPLRDDVVRRRLSPVGDGGGARNDLHHLRGETTEILARLLVRDLAQLAELPRTGETCGLGLQVRRRVAGEPCRLYGSGSGIFELRSLSTRSPQTFS